MRESFRSLRKFFAGEKYVPTKYTKDTKVLMVCVSRFFSRHFVYLVGKPSDSCRGTPRSVAVPSSTQALRLSCADSKPVFRIIRIISVICGQISLAAASPVRVIRGSMVFRREGGDNFRHEFHESTRIKPRVVVRLVTIREISVPLSALTRRRFFRSADRRGAGPRRGAVLRRRSSA